MASGTQDSRHWLKPRLSSVLALWLMQPQGSMRLGLPEQPRQGRIPTRFPVVTFPHPEGQGWLPQGPPCKDGGGPLSQPEPCRPKLLSQGAVPSSPQSNLSFLLSSFQSRVGLWGPGPAEPRPWTCKRPPPAPWLHRPSYSPLFHLKQTPWGFPAGISGKDTACQCRDVRCGVRSQVQERSLERL